MSFVAGTETNGIVYVIKSKLVPDTYKVGITTVRSFNQRMRQLKAGYNPDDKSEIWATFEFPDSDAAREVEKNAHDLFKKYRLPQSEYFSLSKEILSHLIDYLTDSEPLFDNQMPAHSSSGTLTIISWNDQINIIDQDDETIAIGKDQIPELINRLQACIN